MLVYTRIDFPTAGGFYGFPWEFSNNFMIGFTDFSSSRSGSTIHFDLLFISTGTTGSSMPVSVPRNSKTPLTRFGFTIFYLKTWYCINQTFFNTTSNMCEGCPIINCLTCENLTVCHTCDASLNYYLNTTTGQCDTCAITGCITCSGGACTVCDPLLNYLLDGVGGCIQCGAGTFANNNTGTCDSCSLTGCATCQSLTICQVCDYTLNYYLNTTTGLC